MPGLKPAIMSEMLGLNEDVVFSFLFCQSAAGKAISSWRAAAGAKSVF